MREILFRAKEKNGNWVCGDFITVMPRSEELCCIKDHTFLRQSHVCDRNTVGQYTGLTDKNGKKIFEGDIVLSDYYLRNSEKEKEYGIVEYGEFNCSCCDGVYGWQFRNEDIRDYENYVVIGNIYDNPELLEASE